MKLKLYFIFLIFTGVISFAQSQSLAGILDKHLEAHNQEFWDGINTLSADLEWHSQLGDFRAEVWVKRPDNVLIRSDKHRFMEAFNGKESWTLASWTDEEVVEMSATRSFMIKELVYYGTPIKTSDKLNFRGEVEVEGLPCYWIEKIDGNRRDEFFISVKTHLLYKSLITQRFGEKTITLTRTVKKYREFNEIKVPTVVQIKTWMLTSEYVFDAIVLGEGIPSSKFLRPNE